MNAIVKTDETAVMQVPSDPSQALATILRAATDPTLDPEKVERYLAMYERLDNKRAEQDFNAALKKSQSEIPAIFKNKKADKNTYADLEQVNDVVVPITTANGLNMSFGNEDSPLEKHYRVICWLSHDGGHTRKYHADIPADHSGSKNVTQGFGSTISYGRRYLTLMIFNISTTNEDDDGKGSGNGSITSQQAADLGNIIMQNSFDLAVFLKWAQVERLEDIPASSYQKARNALMAKVQAKAGK